MTSLMTHMTSLVTHMTSLMTHMTSHMTSLMTHMTSHDPHDLPHDSHDLHSHGEDWCNKVKGRNEHPTLSQEGSQDEGIARLSIESCPLEEPQKGDEIVIRNGLK